MVNWPKDFKKADKERARLYRLIKKIEYSGSAEGQASGIMLGHKPDKSKGFISRACRICGGIDPEDPFASSWIDEAKGHANDCWLGEIVKEPIK